ncbi:MAG: hypothetical protein FWH01_06270, partial [Oscillospiraceae bacterium]|nr:hypothetical protein [Oscillospiraceae bacterium]
MADQIHRIPSWFPQGGRHLPLRMRFAVAIYALVFGILITFTLLVALLISNYLERSGRETAKQQIAQTSEMLDMFYSTQIKKTDSIQFNPEMRRLLLARPGSVSEALSNRRELAIWLERTAYDIHYPELTFNSNYYGGASELSIFVKNDALLPTNSEFDRIMPYSAAVGTEWYEQLMQEDKALAWENNVIISGIRYVAAYRRILDPNSMQDIALLRICIPVNKIRNVLARAMAQDSVLLLYSDGGNSLIQLDNADHGVTAETLLLQIENNNAEEYITAPNGRQRLMVYTYRSGLNGWSITCALPTSRFWDDSREMIVIFSIAIIMVTVICFLVSMRLAGALTARIKMLDGKVGRLGEGDFNVFDGVGGNDELTRLDNRLM